MAYSERQREAAFQAWYRLGRPSILDFARTYTDPERERAVTDFALRQWKDRFGWDARADELDARAQGTVDDALVEERRAMLNRHRNIAVLLQQKGVAYLNANGVSSDHAAIRAVESGIGLERQVKGLPEMIAAIASMSNEQLLDTYRALMAEGQTQDEEEGIGTT